MLILFLFARQTETALIYDAVKLLATALQDLDQSRSIDVTPISCENGIPWMHGSSLINYMRPITFQGVCVCVCIRNIDNNK